MFIDVVVNINVFVHIDVVVNIDVVASLMCVRCCCGPNLADAEDIRMMGQWPKFSRISQNQWEPHERILFIRLWWHWWQTRYMMLRDPLGDDDMCSLCP